MLGEGATVAVLEDREAAEARGARIYAELVGYGSSLNAYRITDPPPDGGGVILAMGGALESPGSLRTRSTTSPLTGPGRPATT